MEQNRPLIEHLDYTIEDGRWVFSADFLRRRGFCCDQGCRNCPYREPDSVNSSTTSPGSNIADSDDDG